MILFRACMGWKFQTHAGHAQNKNSINFNGL